MLHMMLKKQDDLNALLTQKTGLNFSTMTHSIWSLLMDGALTLDGSQPIMTALIFSDYFLEVLAGIGFIFYMCVTALVIMQMLIGVLCQVVLDVTSAEKDRKDMKVVYNTLLKGL